MKEVSGIAAQWVREGHAFAMATVVGVRGSAPRELGASMLVRADGMVVGNVSGGCVEGAVTQAGLESLASGAASVHTYGISDDEVYGLGLTCGGIVDILVRPIAPGTSAAAQVCLLDDSAGGELGFVLWTGGDRLGEGAIVTAADRDGPLAAAAARISDDRAHVVSSVPEECAEDEGDAMLVVPFGSPPRLIIVGAVEFAVSLSRLGVALGFRVTVVDARTAFTGAHRFPGAEVVEDWPDRYLGATTIDARTAVCVLSHDARFDVPALQVALASPAGYVGAMGSRRTHLDRLERLASAGVSADDVTRLRSPLGLDLGGRTPDETALSILAEVVAHRNGAAGGPLSERDGPIHARTAAVHELDVGWMP